MTRVYAREINVYRDKEDIAPPLVGCDGHDHDLALTNPYVFCEFAGRGLETIHQRYNGVLDGDALGESSGGV
jgi:hypothetical protein